MQWRQSLVVLQSGGNVHLHIPSNSRNLTPHDLFSVSPGIYIKFFSCLWRSNFFSYFEVGIKRPNMKQAGKLNLMLPQIQYFLMALLFWVTYYQFTCLFSLNIWSNFTLDIKALFFVIELSFQLSFNQCLEMWMYLIIPWKHFDISMCCLHAIS